MSAGAGSRRGIAHSSKILGRDKEEAQDVFGMAPLTNGKVDVSFEATLGGGGGLVSPSKSNGKGKARAKDDENGEVVGLFDVDLESGTQTSAAGVGSSKAGRLLQLGTTLPWKKGKSSSTPAYQPPPPANTDPSTPTFSHHAAITDPRDDSLDLYRPHTNTSKTDFDTEAQADEDDYRAFDDDREQLLYSGADDAARPGYFAPGDRIFGYNSLQGGAAMSGYGEAVGFEAVTWREGGWMMLSSVLVGVLVVVAILISMDIIDWPGDGIGKN